MSLLKTTQIILDVCFINDHLAYVSSNKTKIVRIETDSFFFSHPGWMRVYVRAWALGCFRSLISTKDSREGADRVGGQLRRDEEYPFSLSLIHI